MKRLDDLALYDSDLGFTIDLESMGFDATTLEALAPALEQAIAAMKELEGGAVANPDEQRMVGHYWLRAPQLAPTDDMKKAIVDAQQQVKAAAAIGDDFSDAVIVGIGGSSLGPLLVYHALGGDGCRLHFLDNTDPDGIERLLAQLDLSRTLTLVISKSGGTKETRNSMLEMRAAYLESGLGFGEHAIAITGQGSKLDRYAQEHGFRARLPMWDWVGGRTSVMSAVGLLPAALQGADTDALLDGAAAMDTLTRRVWRENPAALLAAAWKLSAGRDMVMLPYKDSLTLISRYLQQLVMESIGKRLDLDGDVVEQGITVYGNKGSTDQHAYVQQLLDGPNDFFVTFIEVLRDREGDAIEVEEGITSGDFLNGFLHGTRRALAGRGRRSLTLTFERVDARTLGAIIALYERAVGLYASLVNVNAYHQPAVEAGKKAAAQVLALQARVVDALGGSATTPQTIAKHVDGDSMAVFFVLRHLAANGRVTAQPVEGEPPWRWLYRLS